MTRVLKSVGAVTLLAVLLVGAPMLLAKVGELPTGLGWTDLRQLLTTPDTTGSAFLWVITIVGWVAWALFSVCVVVEIINRFDQTRLAIRLPGLGMGQRLAGGLVAAAFALTTLQGSQIAIADTHTPAAVTAVTTVAPSQAPIQAPTPAQTPAAHVHVVKSGEYLWQIAERYYGDGAQFPRIAQANQIDPFSDLAVGQKLIIPGITPAAPATQQNRAVPATVTVGPGDSLWSFAQTHLGDGHRWPEIHRLNKDLIADPDLLDDGWVLKMPTTPAITTKTVTETTTVDHAPKTVATTPQTKTETIPETQAPQTTAPQTQARHTPQSPTQTPQEVAVTDDHQDPALVVPAALTGVGLLLTAGLVTTLNRRRRRQLAQRRPGQKITLPGEPAQRMESALRAQEPVDTVQALDTILRVIAEHHHTNQLPLPTLTAARLASTRIDLLLAAPALNAPEGVELTADGAVWTIHADQLSVFTDCADEVAAVNAPWPALVTLGRDDDGANILLDLESAAALTITTEDHETAHALLRGLALDLAVAPWATELNLTLVGDVCPNLEKAMGEPTITRVHDVTALLTSLEARAELQRSVITGTTLGQIRIDPAAADLVDPEIILLDHTLDPQTAQRLAALLSALPRTAVATVTTTPVDVANAWQFQLGGDPLIGRLRPHDWRLHPQTVDTATYLALLDALHSSRQLETTPAPWWNHDPLETLNAPDEDPVMPTATITQLPMSRPVTLPTTSPATDQQPPVEVGQKRAPLSLAPLLGDLDLADIYDDEPTDDRSADVVPVDLSGPPPVEALANPAEIAEVHFLHPTLRVLGPVDLVCARGEFTGVGKVGAMEILMHLMDHPGTSAKDLADTVMISVTTARPKITHLRAWLGAHPETGMLYLPRGNAAGGYRLHPDVTSDWHALQGLITGGVNRSTTTNLVKALKLVRGAPFEATSRGFAFAEAIRVDMISTITDIALQLVDRALDSNDITLARWACGRALDVDPESEALLAARIRTEYQAGNMTEVERLIGRVNRNARTLDVDLRHTTVAIIQQAGAR